MKLYAITDRKLYPGDERERCAALLRQAAHWIAGGVDFIQLREKDLHAAAIEGLTRELVELAARAELNRASAARVPARILVNCADNLAVEAARKANADGVHLPGSVAFGSNGAPCAEQLERVREAWGGPPPVISVACHSVEEVREASIGGAAMALFAPVFEKPLHDGEDRVLAGAGLKMLAEACIAAGQVPIFALGGVTTGKVEECLAAGAAGVAGGRMFAGEGWRFSRRFQG